MKASRPGFLNEIAEIEKGNLSPVYLLYGGDLYLEDEAIKTICESYAQGGKGCPENRVYYGEIDSDRDFIDGLFCIGFFAARQIMIYKNIGKLDANWRPRLLKFIANPDRNTLLVMTAGSEGKSTLVDKLKKDTQKVKTISTWTPDPDRFGDFIRRHLERTDTVIDDDALKLLVSLTDDALSHTIAELEKLLIYIGDSKSIKEADVRLLVGGDKEYDMQNFIDAVARRDLNDSVKIGLALIRANNSIPYFITQLFDLFSAIWDYDGHGRTEKFWKKANCYQAGRNNYRVADFPAIFTRLREADLQSKSLNLSAEEILVPLLYDIIA
jgi:DNA polymerase-3 subunit delta